MDTRLAFTQYRWFSIWSLLIGLLPLVPAGAAEVGPNQDVGPSQNKTTQVVQLAFTETHGGWSSDEVLLQDPLNTAFLRRCQQDLSEVSSKDLNWALLNLRKAGKLKSKLTRRRRDVHTNYHHLAEIVARTMEDKHHANTDRIMCDLALRRDFDARARIVAPNVEPYLMRKAAFGMRKARRLRPELLLRIADWDREVVTYQASDLAEDTSRIPKQPGIYIFRDASGYLYIGESINLRKRLAGHLDQSDRQSLANYLQQHGITRVSIELHVFPSDSRAKRVSVRRAYESALIDSRKPRFNVRP